METPEACSVFISPANAPDAVVMSVAFVFILFCSEPDTDSTWPEANAATPQLTPDILTPDACSVFTKLTKAPETVSISLFRAPEGERTFTNLDEVELYCRMCLSATLVIVTSLRSSKAPAASAAMVILAILFESTKSTLPLVNQSPDTPAWCVVVLSSPTDTVPMLASILLLSAPEADAYSPDTLSI